jgi:hypothetical protein
MFGNKFEYLNEIIEGALEEEKLLENVAKLHRRMFEELTKQGFTDSEAIELMKHKDLLNVS